MWKFFLWIIHKTLDKILENYSDRVKQIHISENNGLKDEHKVLEKNSWQYVAIKKITEIKNKNIYYCLEARNAKNKKDIKECLNEINNIIS